MSAPVNKAGSVLLYAPVEDPNHTPIQFPDQE